MTYRLGNPEEIGPLLTRLRWARGLSQLRTAEKLCDVSGTPTVSRHEVSRWERGQRVPSPFWLNWLSAVLEAPLQQLEAAARATRGQCCEVSPGRPCQPRLGQPISAADLLAALDHTSPHHLHNMAHAWLTRAQMTRPHPPRRVWLHDSNKGTGRDALTKVETALGRLRRADDLIGGLDLAHRVDASLREAIALLHKLERGDLRRRAWQAIAGHAQLAGWVHTDTGNHAAARGAYRVALHAAAEAEDRLLAAYTLASLSHQNTMTGNPDEALLLAQTGLAGAHGDGAKLTRVLLLHRVAAAAACAGDRPATQAALTAAERAANRCQPEETPAWLYWLDHDELSAMTGRCLAMIGRPLRATRLLAQRRTAIGARTQAIYDGWLARSYLELGEIEEACRIAGRVLSAAVTAGSVRAADTAHHLRPMLLRHRDIPAVRDYEHLTHEADKHLPRRDCAVRRT